MTDHRSLTTEGLSSLVFSTREISLTELESARRLAFIDGRVIEHDHRSVFAFGEAARLRLANGTSDSEVLHHIAQLLKDIPSKNSTTTAVPIAIGALPFDREALGELIIPKVVVVHVPDAFSHVVVVASATEIDAELSALVFSDENTDNKTPATAFEAPYEFSLNSVRSHTDFKRRVADAVQAISDGDIQKVVLAREVIVEANQPFRQSQLLERMRVLFPSCAAFAIDGFVGASPELLCRRTNKEVLSYPLAGTVPRSGDPDDDLRLAEQLLHSKKDRAEHAYVVDMIADVLSEFCDEDVLIDGPHLLELRNVAHLATKLHATLATHSASNELPNALELAGALHPTPAVGGVPRAAALAYLDKFEEIDRDRYAGPVGYVDANGDGEWWIGIRSAVIDGNTARLFAGVGIVDSSDPESELIETQLKLQALLSTAVRP